MLTEFTGNLAHHLDFGHVLVIVAKTIDSATRFDYKLIHYLLYYLFKYIINRDQMIKISSILNQDKPIPICLINDLISFFIDFT